MNRADGIVSFYKMISVNHNLDLILHTECNLTIDNIRHRTECTNVLLSDAGETKFKDSNQASCLREKNTEKLFCILKVLETLFLLCLPFSCQ